MKDRNSYNWTADDHALLKTLWIEGADVSFIAQSFGVTRNAVLGMRHRLKLPRRRRPTKGPEYDMLKRSGFFKYS